MALLQQGKEVASGRLSSNTGVLHTASPFALVISHMSPDGKMLLCNDRTRDIATIYHVRITGSRISLDAMHTEHAIDGKRISVLGADTTVIDAGRRTTVFRAGKTFPVTRWKFDWASNSAGPYRVELKANSSDPQPSTARVIDYRTGDAWLFTDRGIIEQGYCDSGVSPNGRYAAVMAQNGYPALPKIMWQLAGRMPALMKSIDANADRTALVVYGRNGRCIARWDTSFDYTWSRAAERDGWVATCPAPDGNSVVFTLIANTDSGKEELCCVLLKRSRW